MAILLTGVCEIISVRWLFFLSISEYILQSTADVWCDIN